MTGGKHEHGSCFKILHYHYGLLLLCLTGNMHRCILCISISAAKRKKNFIKCLIAYFCIWFSPQIVVRLEICCNG